MHLDSSIKKIVYPRYTYKFMEQKTRFSTWISTFGKTKKTQSNIIIKSLTGKISYPMLKLFGITSPFSQLVC